MNAKREISLVFSVDVEEEGLFSGSYSAIAQGVSNVAALSRLEFLTRDFGLPLTLLCTWPVLSDPVCADMLRRWQDELGAEVGLHLHPWNTPPLRQLGNKAWTPSEDMPGEVLDAKLDTLVRACQDVTGCAPASFRMGRFDLGPKVRALLPGHDLRVDSSLVPMRWCPVLPEAFLSHTDPYVLLQDEAGLTQLLEVPLTMAALLPGLPACAWRLASGLGPGARKELLRNFQRVAVVGPQPAWYTLPAMKLGVRLHLARGGEVIHLFLHSSELQPGACPHLPDDASVERLVARIHAFILWLRTQTLVRGATLARLFPHAEART